MSKFKVGDKVRGISADIEGCELIIVKDTGVGYHLKITKEGGKEWQHLPYWGVGSIISRSSYWVGHLELIESNNKTNNMSVKSKIKQIMRSEPEKTFVEVGFLDDNENITEDGRAILEQILWDANKDKLKELADKVLESEND